MPSTGLSGTPDCPVAIAGLSGDGQGARETLAAPEKDNYHAYVVTYGKVYEQTSKG